MAIFQGLIGLAGLIVLAWAISENRRAFPWRTAAVGLVVQAPLGWLPSAILPRSSPSVTSVACRR